MASFPALIVWAGISMVAVMISIFYPGLNPKERVSISFLISAATAGILCGFTMSVTWGLGMSAAILASIALLMGYEEG